MKKIIMGLSFVVAFAGAAFTSNNSMGADSLTNLTLYKPVANCPSRICTDQATGIICTDLKQVNDCSGSNYSGTFRRTTP